MCCDDCLAVRLLEAALQSGCMLRCIIVNSQAVLSLLNCCAFAGHCCAEPLSIVKHLHAEHDYAPCKAMAGNVMHAELLCTVMHA